MRRLLTLGIVASWVVTATLLAERHLRPRGADLPPAPAAGVDERDEWFGVYQDGRKVGHARRLTARTGTGFVLHEDSTVALAMLGVPQTVRTALVVETDRAFALSRFAFTLVSPATVFSANGSSDGRRLAVTYGQPGHEARLEVPLETPIHLPSTLRPRVLAQRPEPGTRYSVPVFSPVTLRNEPMTVVVEARETVAGPEGPVEALRLAEEYQALTTRAWIGPDGLVIREEAALGFTLEREDRARALGGLDGRAPVDLVAASRIPLTGTIDDPRGAARLVLRVSGAAAAAVPDDPPRQRVDGSVVRIAREILPPPPHPVPPPPPPRRVPRAPARGAGAVRRPRALHRVGRSGDSRPRPRDRR
jgi:hypothetical protein